MGKWGHSHPFPPRLALFLDLLLVQLPMGKLEEGRLPLVNTPLSLLCEVFSNVTS